MQQLQLPKPDLIIVDEVHKANCGFPDAVFRFLERFRSVFALGLTATLGSGDGNTEKAVARLLGLDVRALPAAVITIPSCANAAVYPAADFEFRQVRMLGLHRGPRDRQLRHNYPIDALPGHGRRRRRLQATRVARHHEEPLGGQQAR